MLVTIKNQIEIEDITPELKAYCKENFVMRNPEYDKRARLGLWARNIPEYLHLYERLGNGKYNLPYGCLEQIQPFLAEAIVSNKLTNIHKVNINADFMLYGYQQEAVDEMAKHFVGILQAPAGTGKTQMGLALACKLKLKTLWLTHTLDLVQQSYNRAKTYLGRENLGIIASGKVDIGEFITFATVQTMSKLNIDLYAKEFDCVIVDECHRISGTPTNITMFSKVLNNLYCQRVYGLTATVHRSDGTLPATKALVGDIAYQVSQEEVQDKILQVGIKPVKTDADITSDCLNSDGTLSYAKLLNHLSEDVNRNKVIMNCLEKDKPSLFLSDRISQLDTLKAMLPNSEQSKAVIVTGKTPKQKREKDIQAMRDGKKQYLFATYQLAKEGLDIPRLERLYMCTPIKDYAIVTQSIGRIDRTTDGKQEAICYDFVDANRYLQKCFKQRLAHYKKSNCYQVN